MNKAFKSLKLTNKHQSNSFRSLIKYFEWLTVRESVMASKPANKRQKDFMKDMTDFISEVGLGYLYKGYGCSTYMQRHHVVGRSAKHNKINIGHDFIIPVPVELHEPNYEHKYHVGKCKKAFVSEFGKQCDIFEKLIWGMVEYGYSKNIADSEVIKAIMDTNA